MDSPIASGSASAASASTYLLMSKYPHYLVLPLMLWYISAHRMAFVATIVLLVFFRNPDRYVLKPVDVADLTSPADGVIMSVYRQKGNKMRIAIFLSVFDVHVQYAPCAGVIHSRRYKPGEFNPAYLLEKSRYNERLETEIVTRNGKRITIVQIAGQIANRIDTFVSKGDSIQRGDRLGIIKFGSRVDLIVSENDYAVSHGIYVGRRVVAGETVLFHPRSSVLPSC